MGFEYVLLPTNHPVRVAERIATLDVLSNGRVEFGTGRGSSPYEIEPFGTPMADTKAKWEEALSMIPRMMTQEVFSHKGKYFNIEPREIWPKPLQKPHPPLWMACGQPASFEAGRKGIGALAFRSEPEGLVSMVQMYRDAINGAQPVGLAINNQVAAFALGLCLPEDQEAIEVARPAVLWHSRAALRNRDLDWGQREIPDHYQYSTSGLYCIGSPDSAIQTIEKYVKAGVDQIMLLMQFGGIPHDKIMESIRLFGEHIIPHFKSKEADSRNTVTQKVANP